MGPTSASALRSQIEAALAHRIPSALTPAPRIVRPVAPTGIAAVDELLHGGLPLGAITEIAGPECSGRTSLALSFVAHLIREAKVCAWIDVSNTFDPLSAAAVGVDLNWFLWVRCGVSKPSNSSRLSEYASAPPEQCSIPAAAFERLHHGSFGGHPRGEVKGLSEAVSVFLRPQSTTPCCGEPQPRLPLQKKEIEPVRLQADFQPAKFSGRFSQRRAHLEKPWSRIDQALHIADLLLQAGGFSAIVLDMGSIAPEYATRVPLATWFRYRAAAERTQASILLLTQHACARSSASLLLSMQQGSPLREETTVFTGIEHRLTLRRERFQPEPFSMMQTNVIPIRRPPQSEREASWQSHPAWAGTR